MRKEKQLQQIIAHSMYTGSLLAEQNYGGEITDKKRDIFSASLLRLKELVDEFSATNLWEEVSVDTILPLHKEIETVLNQKDHDAE